jgi:hypothetical protein
MAFGDRSLNNSIHTAKLYASYSAESRNFTPGQVVDRRHIVYYSNTDALTTQQMAEALQVLTDVVPEGWNGVIAPDPDGARYLLLSNFASDRKCVLSGISCELGAPVFSVPTVIEESKASATFACEMNHSVSEELRIFIKGDNITAIQATDDSYAVYLQTQKKQTEVTVSIVSDNTVVSSTFTFDGCVKVSAEGGSIKVSRKISAE